MTFGDDEEAPLEPLGKIVRLLGHQRPFATRIGLRKIGHDCRTFADDEVAVLQQRYLLAGIELCVLWRFGLTAPTLMESWLIALGSIWVA
ncbi:hypothetical protein CQ14_38675 [Bradyrhizobium lablabi]|uniref:Uncharacterized protein n=1 Tax=Bradyrhizobium lablabi TaxID=722472 RepID=A0A0R3M7B4_9BRAD|nr:hypothetical protein CQ14_38675 [Bradyrhizobium lablabi]